MAAEPARRPRYIEQARADFCLTAIVAEKSRRSLAWFTRYSWHVLESNELEWTPFLQAQCDTLQAFFEGWLLANDTKKKREARAKDADAVARWEAMVARQNAYWAAHGLERVEGELLVQDLHINGWPGSVKSRLAMVIAPAWVWLFDPTFAMAATSGTGDNISRDSNMMKTLVSSSWYRETFKIPWAVGVNDSGDIVDAVAKWSQSGGGGDGGYRLSKELLSKWQGVHVDCLAIDDPDDEVRVYGEAERKLTRSKVLAIQDRVRHPTKSVRMIVQQHVHPQDCCNHIQSLGTWSPQNRSLPAVLRLPLEFRAARRIATPWGWTDPRTAEGEVAHPERHPSKWIEAKRTLCGSALFEAKYNQNAKAGDGGDIKPAWFRFCVVEGMEAGPWERPAGCRPRPGQERDGLKPDAPVVIRRRRDGRLDVDWLVLSIDPKGGSKREESSNVGAVVIAGKGTQRFILDDQSEVLGWLDTMERIRSMLRKWKPDRVFIEEKQQGSSALETLRQEMADGSLKDSDGKPIICTFEGVEGGSTSFLERFRAMLPIVEAGLVCVLDGAEWADKYIDEHCTITSNTDKATLTSKGKKTDRVDATSQCLNHIEKHGTITQQFAAYANMGAALGLR